MGSIFSLDDFLDMTRRRARLIFVVIVLGTLASLGIALNQPHEYESAEVLQILQPKIADDFAKSTVDGSSARRLQMIQQRLMARDMVLETAERLGVFADQPEKRDSEKVAIIRQAVQIEGVAAAREGYTDDGTISVLTITARMPTPELAQSLAHEFGTRTIELSKQNRREKANETLAFFLAQEKTLASQIGALEDEITKYRNDNNLSLPGSVAFRREEIATINSGLLDIARERIEVERGMEQVEKNERRATADRLRADFQEKLATLDAQTELLVAKKRELEQLIESSPAIERRLASYDRRLTQLRDEMERIAARRTDAELGLRLEDDLQAERLTVIEEAAKPDFPVTESRKKKAIAGAGLSVIAAFAFAFLLDMRNPVLRSSAQVERELGFKPVVTVPFLDTRAPKKSFWGRIGQFFSKKPQGPAATD
jgi:protein tyrosine kinase modulator